MTTVTSTVAAGAKEGDVGENERAPTTPVCRLIAKGVGEDRCVALESA